MVQVHGKAFVRVGIALLLVLGLMPPPNAGAATRQAPVRVGDASDPTDASIQLSQFQFGPAGSCTGCAQQVVIGRSDSFPDNLAGAAAAGVNAPLLLHPPAPATTDSRVLNEVVRVLGPRTPFPCHGGDADVLVLGGTAALSTTIEDDLRARNYCVERAGGASRIETAVAVGEFVALRANGGGGPSTLPRVYLATAGNPADSASASARAAKDGTPILVTDSSGLAPAVADFLLQVTPGEVVLLGGQAALSTQVEQDVQFTLRNANTTVSRIAGVSRDDTARQVAVQLWPASPPQVVVVNGYSPDFWVWALPGAVTAARLDAPLLYVQPTSVPGPTCDWLFGARPPGSLGVGPEAQIAGATLGQVRDIADNVATCGGSTTPPPPPPPTTPPPPPPSSPPPPPPPPTGSTVIVDTVLAISGPSFTVSQTVEFFPSETATIEVFDQGGTDPRVAVFDSAGGFHGDDDDGAGFPNSRFVFNVPFQDNYQIVIDDLNQTGGNVQLRISVQ